MVGVLVEQEGEISLMARSKCAFVHAQDIYVLTECGGKCELFPPYTHLFPCGRSSSKENSQDRFPSAEIII